MSKVTKAIFCVAGFGTRFLPATKAQPKEMLPLVDKPIIQYLVEEAVEAGIQDIIFVTGRGKSSIENHFDKSFELEYSLVEKGKHQLVEEVDRISKLANFAYVRQPVQKGDGHALLCAEPYVDLPEPVLVVFPDYYMPSSNNTFKRMIKAYEHYGETVIATDFVTEQMVPQYGAVMYEDVGMENTAKIAGFVEKPKPDQIPAGLVRDGYGLINNGYAIINHDVWDALKQAESTGGDGEIRVADAFVKLLQSGSSIYAIKPIQAGYDCGNKIGFLKATVDLALERDDLGEEFREFLRAKFN
ncbi:MAG: UTP--glucose-1-phosphate uridylyltransferase GalU [Patescibacteria group bacterium]